jgi:predicted DNA-binding protein
MDKVFSARVDESIVNRIGVLARELHTTKKTIIERAIDLFSEKVEKEQNVDILDLTYGAWNRTESVQSTVREARRTFRDSMTRHHG